MPLHLMPVSRRRFLAGLGTAVTVAERSLARETSTVDKNSWALLSDTHLLSEDSIRRHYSGSRAAREKRAEQASQNFDRAAAQVNALPEKPAGMLLNGDCVHVGGRDEYAQLADKLARFGDTPVHVTMGNHDQRQDFHTTFRERFGGDRVLLESRHVSVVKSQRANFVLLDSLTMEKPRSPVKGPGILGKKQLAWLESQLDAAADKPTFVMLHHNLNPGQEYQPHFGATDVLVPSLSPFKGLAGGLEDSNALLDVLLSRPHVKAVVTGHMHQFRVFRWRRIHFISLPAVGYTFHADEPPGWAELALQEGGATLMLRTLDPQHARNRHQVNLSWS